eukprot:7139436-Prymnesium_polylepis.1
MAPPRPALSPVAGEVSTRLASRSRRWTCQFGHVLYTHSKRMFPTETNSCQPCVFAGIADVIRQGLS